MKYEATIVVPHDVALKIKRALAWKEGDSPDYRLGEDDTIYYTAEFENGLQADVKCCGCQYDERDPGNNCAWAEMVLFTPQGSEVACSEVSDEYFGEWSIYGGNDDEYIVNVVEETTDENEVKTFPKDLKPYLEEGQRAARSAAQKLCGLGECICGYKCGHSNKSKFPVPVRLFGKETECPLAGYHIEPSERTFVFNRKEDRLTSDELFWICACCAHSQIKDEDEQWIVDRDRCYMDVCIDCPVVKHTDYITEAEAEARMS